MISGRRKPCLGALLLVSSLGFGAFFSYWIIAESDDEKVHRVFVEHDKLVLQGKRKQAQALFAKALSAEGNGGPLKPIWAPLIQAQGNGYVQLQYYVRILAGDPDRRETYEEIANLMETAPDVFHLEVKPAYLSDIAAVPGVRSDLLGRYGLFIEEKK